MKRFALLALKGLGLLSLALLALVLAWAAFNNRWIDAGPQPVPERLRLAAPTVAADSNIFFAFIGLDEPGPPLQAGQVQWAALQRGDDGTRLAPKPWNHLTPMGCGQDEQACVEQWVSQAQALSVQLQADEVRGERCAALAAPGLAFEELLTGDTYLAAVNATLSAHTTAANGCVRWLLASAVVAADRGLDVDSFGRLDQADRLMRLQLVGSQTLISNAIAWRAARLQWQTVAALVARHPAWAGLHAERLTVLLRSLPEQALSAQRWIAAEASMGRMALLAIANECKANRPDEDEGMYSLGRFLSCKLGVGYMPQTTVQAADQLWVERLAQNDSNAKQAPAQTRFIEPQVDGGWRWKNTIGHILISVSQPSWNGYAQKQADVELLRQTAALAVQMASIASGQRGAWLKAQPIDAALRERIRLSGDGYLFARSWQEKPESPDFRFPLVPI